MKKILIALVVASLMLPLAACKEEGPAEKAGKKIDEAVDSVTDSAKKLFD